MAEVVRLPLRERKHARTKLALMGAALEAMERQPLEEIPVKALCEAAMVSEATFFNYFPRKSDILAYFIRLWVLEMAWHGERAREGRPGLGAVEALFKHAAERIQRQPAVMGEVIAYQARQREKPRSQEISRAERALAFPQLDGIEDVQATGLDSVLVPSLQQAVAAGELPPNSHLPTIMVGLIAIFYGVPLALRLGNPQSIASMYTQQLQILWAGARAVAGGPGPQR